MPQRHAHDDKTLLPGLFLAAPALSRSQSSLTHRTLTRSASEERTCRPRLRFGLVWFRAGDGVKSRVATRARRARIFTIGPLVIAWVALGILGNFLLPAELPAQTGAAQTGAETAIQRWTPVSPEQRRQLYDELSNQARILEAQAAVVKTVAKLVGPTVVHIEAAVNKPAGMQRGRNRLIEEAGSGVIVQLGAKYYVLTNRHVIKDASPERIKITLADGRKTRAKREQVWTHRETDVAVMGIDVPDLVAARIGDSGKMEVGDFVLTVGSPFGLSHSITYGIVSAKGRRHLDLDPSEIPLQNFIQTDAAINPGNSGGPLINLRGEVIGINCAIASPTGSNSGVGFAIPVNMVMTVARQLVSGGSVRWAYLGVNLDETFGFTTAARLGLPRLTGALVTTVISDSPAEAAGLRSNDIIVQVGETAIDDLDHLVDVIKMTEVGKEIFMVIFRDRQPIAVKVAVAQRESPPEVTESNR